MASIGTPFTVDASLFKRFGLGGRGGDAVDRLLDELRLAPVVQLGVSYAF